MLLIYEQMYVYYHICHCICYACDIEQYVNKPQLIKVTRLL